MHNHSLTVHVSFISVLFYPSMFIAIHKEIQQDTESGDRDVQMLH